MSLSDLASLGSFVSGVAVLVSLVFLYFQVRQVNAQVSQAERNQRALMQQGRSARVMEATFHRLEPHNVEALQRGMRGETDMSDSQVFSYVTLVMTTFMNWEDSYLQHRAGAIDPESWAADDLRLRHYLGWPSYRAVWRIVRTNFGEKYRAHVDALMREAGPMTPVDTAEAWRTYVAEEMARLAPRP